jgi:hypothetical protein
MSSVVNKNDAKAIIDRLPDDATWDDLMHEIYVRQAIESGLADSKAGRTKSVYELREKYGLTE